MPRDGARAAPALAWLAAVAVLMAVYRTDLRDAVAVWLRSTAYGHCLLVLPIALWLAWERRGTGALGHAARPTAAGVWLMPPCVLAWFAAERLGVVEARQLALLGMVWVLALCCLGPRSVRAMAVPLAYLVFLVPFGAFLVPTLQDVTAREIDLGLTLATIPHLVDRTTIEIPEGTFRVAEACAGLRFLIASIAFGVLYAVTIYRSAARRAAFVAACVVVPVLANGLRAFGIVVLGHWRGSAVAGATDHVLYGWLFFSLVILSLILIGLPFREDTLSAHERPALPDRPAGAARAPAIARAVLPALALACAGAGAAGALDRLASASPVPLPAGAAARLASLRLPGCTDAAPPAAGARTLSCGGEDTLRLALRAFGPRAGVDTLLPALRAEDPRPVAGRDDAADVRRGTFGSCGGTWSLTSLATPPLAAASAVWFDGRPHVPGVSTRLALARSSLAGDGGVRLVATIAAAGPGAAQAAEAAAAALCPIAQP